MISFESLIECDFLYLLDFESEVEDFEEQPLTISYTSGSSILHYTPDFRICQKGEQRLVECKPEALLGTEENRRKFTAATAWCLERHWTFYVVTDRELRAGFRLKNVKLLTRYARQWVRPEVRGRIYASLRANASPLTLGELTQTLAPLEFPAALASVLHLAFHHEVQMALDERPLSVNSSVELSVSMRKEK